jgi:hypothetical protein
MGEREKEGGREGESKSKKSQYTDTREVYTYTHARTHAYTHIPDAVP